MSVKNVQQVDKNINWVEKIKNVEKLYAQFVEKCQNGYYKKVGVYWKNGQARFNQAVLDSYNDKNNPKEKTDYSLWFTAEQCDEWLKKTSK